MAPGLEAVIVRCLAKERGDRFDDVGQLARALAPYATARGCAAVARTARIIENSHLVSAVTTTSSTPPGQAEEPPAGPASQRAETNKGHAPAGRTGAGRTGAGRTGAGRTGGRTRWRTRRDRLVAFVLTTLAALAAGIALARRSQASRAAPEARDEVLAPQAVVVLSIRVEPASARVFVDDAEVPREARTLRLRRDDVMHTVRFESPGYRPIKRLVALDRDLDLVVRLEVEGASGER